MELLEDIGFLLSRGGGLAIRTANAHLGYLGLRVRHYSVLSVACDAGGISQRKLSEVLGLDPSQIVALVDDLDDQGLVERLPDPQDRRTRLVAPTRRGKTVRRRARRDAAEAREVYLAALSEQERAILLDLLLRVAFPRGVGDDKEVAS